MKKTDQKGFAAIEAVLVLVIVGIVGFTGYFVWNAKQNTDKTLADTANSQPGIAAKKKTAAPKAQDATTKWLQVTSKNGGFTVRVPDGWSGVNYSGADQIRFTTVDFQSGKSATITEAETPYAGDSEVPVTIALINTPGPDTALIPDAVVSDHDLGKYDGTKFYKKYMESTPEGVGARNKGDADYAYRIDIAKDKVLYIYYSTKAGQTDQHELVEQFISTITVK